MATLSGYGPHTAAKHRILRRYLQAWLPIMSQQVSRGKSGEPALLLIDGFAGPGRYEHGEQGSPLIMLDTYMEHSHRDQITRSVDFIFIEKKEEFSSHLAGEVEAKSLNDGNIFTEVRQGLFADELPRVLSDAEGRHGRAPATFAFIDPFGLKDNSLELTSGIAVQRGGEVLAYLPTGFMARFKSADEFAPALDHLYGGRDAWAYAKAITNHEDRRVWLRDRFGEVLCEQSGGRFLSFDIQPQGSPNIYSLVFSSQSRRGIQRMKEAMWKVDPVSGQFFRGGLRPTQPDNLLDLPGAQDDVLASHVGSSEPDYGALELQLRQRFGNEAFGVEEVSDFVLFETVFRDDKHLKRPVLGELERTRSLEVVSSPRERSTPGAYPDGTVVRFVD